MGKRTRTWMAVVVLFGAAAGASVAEAQDAILYELTESVKPTTGGASFKSSESTLAGWVMAGTNVCPTIMGLPACSVIVRAVGKASDDTGIGPFKGSFQIVVQNFNTYDGAELVVANGSISGQLDLSPAFLGKAPLGTITGDYSMDGVANTVLDKYRARGAFAGTFRIPFGYEGRAAYMMDDGSIVPVRPEETALGIAAVRLELLFR